MKEVNVHQFDKCVWNTSIIDFASLVLLINPIKYFSIIVKHRKKDVSMVYYPFIKNYWIKLPSMTASFNLQITAWLIACDVIMLCSAQRVSSHGTLSGVWGSIGDHPVLVRTMGWLFWSWWYMNIWCHVGIFCNLYVLSMLKNYMYIYYHLSVCL